MEWIKYHEAEKVFDLRTEHSTYQMQVREYDTLVHLYYGSPVGDALITDRIVCVDRGFSGNPYEAEKDKTFSLDTLPQEYTTSVSYTHLDVYKRQVKYCISADSL